eukprot:15788-Heterococcus_DN1.PRE.2
MDTLTATCVSAHMASLKHEPARTLTLGSTKPAFTAYIGCSHQRTALALALGVLVSRAARTLDSYRAVPLARAATALAHTPVDIVSE